MRKLSREEREWNVRKQNHLLRRQLKSTSRKINRIEFTGTRLPSPFFLCIYEDQYYENTIKYIKSIARKVIKENRSVIIDLSNLERITAAAILCLYAEISRCVLMTNRRSAIRFIKPKKQEIRGLLSGLKFFNVVDVMAGELTVQETKNNVVIPCITGIKADERIEGIMSSIEKGLHEGEIEEEEEQTLYRSLTEAMLNVWQHAYSSEKVADEEKDAIGKRWWLLGHRLDKELYIAIYDRGVGIPETLPRKYSIEVITDFLEKLKLTRRTDANMIYAAMELGRTRTGKPGRGKGLEDVQRFVAENPNGVLRIYSNRGGYVYRTEHGKIERYTRKLSIKGTLIQWNVRLD